jgi:hypothetical protein
MTFTGTLIEDLMATVERVEQRTQGDASVIDPMLIDACTIQPWLASGSENSEYEPKFLGVA